MDKLNHRFPSIDGSEIKELVTTARAFTPDGHILIGPLPRVRCFKNYVYKKVRNLLYT